MSTKPDSRQRLIDAAVEIIATKGESALRLAEVAEMAGMKQPSIHYIFPTREDLVVAALRERYQRAVLEAIDSYEDLISKAATRDEFVKATYLTIRFAMDDSRKAARATRLALLVKAETNPELLKEINDVSFAANQKLAGLIGNAQRQGWIRAEASPLTLAVWIRGLILGRYVLEVDSDRYDGEEWTKFALSLVESVIFGDGSGDVR